MPINSKWFRDLLADKKISANKFAELNNFQRTGLSKMINGVYEMSPEVMAAFSSYFGVAYEVVARHAGLPVPKVMTRMVRIIGQVEKTGRVVKAAKGEMVDRPAGASDATVALAMPGFYDWVVYYNPSKRVEPEAFGRLAVCELESGGRYLRVLERGRLKALCGADIIEGKVVSASPVIGIKTV